MIVYSVEEPDYETITYLPTKAAALQHAAEITAPDDDTPWNVFYAVVRQHKVERLDKDVVCDIANSEPAAAWCDRVKVLAYYQSGKRIKKERK